MYYLIFILFIVVSDLTSKIAIHKKYDLNKDVCIHKNINIRHIKNNGMALGFLSKFPKFICSVMFITNLIFAFTFGLIFKQNNKIKKAGYSFILGGGIGNFIDRMCNNSITDFIYIKTDKKFRNKKINMPIFNIADISILIGSILLIISDVCTMLKLKKLN